MSCREPAPSGSEGCQGWHEFLQIPIAIGTDKWTSVWCHDEVVQMASKKQGTSASTGSPIDFVSVAGSVKLI